MVKVVVDTNVFISGILFGGNPERILHYLLKRKFICCISPVLKAEIINKLKWKFLSNEQFIVKTTLFLDQYSQKYLPKHKVRICADPNDNFLLELAETAKAKYLISGDKKVLDLKTYKYTQIISVREFLNILESLHG